MALQKTAQTNLVAIPSSESIDVFIRMQNERYCRLIERARFTGVNLDDIHHFSHLAQIIEDNYDNDKDSVVHDAEAFFEMPFYDPVNPTIYLKIKHPIKVESTFTNPFSPFRHILPLYFLEQYPDRLEELDCLIGQGEVKAMEQVVSTRIRSRNHLLETIVEQINEPIIDATAVDTYSSTQQALNYAIATSHPYYKIHKHEEQMLEALVGEGSLDFRSGKLVVYCFSSGSGLKELALVDRVKRRYKEQHGLDLALVLRFVEQSDWSRFGVNVANGLGYSNANTITRNIFGESIVDILNEDSEKLDMDYSVLLLSLNSLVGFPSEFQNKFMRELGIYLQEHSGKDVKSLVSLTTQRDLFPDSPTLTALLRIIARTGVISDAFCRNLSEETETSYQHPDAEPFALYPIEELLLADPKSVRYKVWQDIDNFGSQRYNIGVEVVEPIPLFNQYGEHLSDRQGRELILNKGKLIKFHQSTRVNAFRVTQLAQSYGFRVKPVENNPQVVLYR